MFARWRWWLSRRCWGSVAIKDQPQNALAEPTGRPEGHPAVAEPALTVVVDIADGSRVVGVPAVAELKIVTPLGRVNVPLKNIAQVVFNADNTLDFDVGAGSRGYANGNTPLDAVISVK